jgi:uncharacterized protein YecE (DUF72 family)
MSARAYIGTSGWNYESWKASFYRGVPRRQWLAYCASRFSAIEVNATFYRLPSRSTFRRWREETPPEFRFAIKAHRYLTHNKKLADPLPAIQRERARATALGEKLAAVVWQLPAHFHKHLARLEDFARALARSWGEVRHAVEFRHPSWFDDEVAACLAHYGIANCQSDAADWPRWDAVTTDMVYVRLHGHETTYASAYTPAALAAWARRIRGWLAEGRDVHVYFDNDALGHAPFDALALRKLVGEGQPRHRTRRSERTRRGAPGAPD